MHTTAWPSDETNSVQFLHNNCGKEENFLKLRDTFAIEGGEQRSHVSVALRISFKICFVTFIHIETTRPISKYRQKHCGLCALTWFHRKGHNRGFCSSVAKNLWQKAKWKVGALCGETLGKWKPSTRQAFNLQFYRNASLLKMTVFLHKERPREAAWTSIGFHIDAQSWLRSLWFWDVWQSTAISVFFKEHDGAVQF